MQFLFFEGGCSNNRCALELLSSACISQRSHIQTGFFGRQLSQCIVYNPADTLQFSQKVGGESCPGFITKTKICQKKRLLVK